MGRSLYSAPLPGRNGLTRDNRTGVASVSHSHRPWDIAKVSGCLALTGTGQ